MRESGGGKYSEEVQLRLRSALAGDALDQSGRALSKFYLSWERKM
jgi:hypothetical protein